MAGLGVVRGKLTLPYPGGCPTCPATLSSWLPSCLTQPENGALGGNRCAHANPTACPGSPCQPLVGPEQAWVVDGWPPRLSAPPRPVPLCPPPSSLLMPLDPPTALRRPSSPLPMAHPPPCLGAPLVEDSAGTFSRTGEEERRLPHRRSSRQYDPPPTLTLTPN